MCVWPIFSVYHWGATVQVLPDESTTILPKLGIEPFFFLLAWKNMFKTTGFDTCLRFAWMKINRCAWSDVFLCVLGTGRLGLSVSSLHHLWGSVTFLQTQMCQFPHHQVWQSGLSRSNGIARRCSAMWIRRECVASLSLTLSLLFSSLYSSPSAANCFETYKAPRAQLSPGSRPESAIYVSCTSSFKCVAISSAN